jgi:exopolysaccharide biosynthesis polyprenyl glycosylphosphotransferase
MIRLLRFLGYRPAVMLLDTAIVNMGSLLAFMALWQGSVFSGEHMTTCRNLMLVNSLAVIVSFQLLDLYGNWLRCSRAHLLYCVVVASTSASAVTLAIGFLLGQLTVPRSILLLAAALQMALVCIFRLLGSAAYRHWFGGRKTVVVGETAQSAWEIAEEFGAESGLYSVQRYITRGELTPAFGALDEAATVVLASNVRDKEQIVLHCFRRFKEVLIVPDISELTSYGAEVRGVQDLLMFAVHPHRLGPAERLVKRVFDLLAASLLLALATPIFVTLAVLIPLTSRGPVFYRQERLGRYRRRFFILKFRTMKVNAEKLTGPVLATEHDPRITRLGRFLRATKIDELPQLWNVLRGEMSLVGPRPEREFFVHQYEKVLPAYELRHSVKPGVTGFAQTKGRYSSSVERKLHFDLLYIYRYSLLLDIKILFQTIIVMLRAQQSEGVKAITSRPRSHNTGHIPSDDYIPEPVARPARHPANPV